MRNKVELFDYNVTHSHSQSLILTVFKVNFKITFFLDHIREFENENVGAGMCVALLTFEWSMQKWPK